MDIGIVVVFEDGIARKIEMPIDSRFTMYGEEFMVHRDSKHKSQWLVTEAKSGAVCSAPQDENGKSITNAKPHKSKISAIETAKKNLTTYISKGNKLDTAIRTFIKNVWGKTGSKSNRFLELKLLKIIK